MHSRRSDGTGTLEEIAEAAAAASLRFVIVTDHGDGTRAPEPPTYRSGVLLLDGVEISTTDGHYVAFGLSEAPYKLGGTAEAVAEDVRRLGGLGFAAHPDSNKAELRWTADKVDIDGMEWLNADTEWRDELWRSLGTGLLTYPFRPAETLASLIDRPTLTLARWAELSDRARVVALAGADAHARLGFGSGREPYDDRVVARVPSYVAAFRTFSNHLTLPRPLVGQAGADAATVREAIASGRVFTTLDGLGASGPFEFTGASGSTRVHAGDYLEISGPVLLEGRIAVPSPAALTVYRGAQAVYQTGEPHFRIDVGNTPGAYRVEATLVGRGRAGVPWLLSNPVYVGLRARHAAAQRKRRPAVSVQAPMDIGAWSREVSEGSRSEFQGATGSSASTRGQWRFALSSISTSGAPYAALRFPVGQPAVEFDRVLLSVQSRRPMRLWLQLRSPDGGQRWGRTFFVDGEARQVTIFLDELRALGGAPALSPENLAQVDSLLLVADLLHHVPGGSGEVVVGDVLLAR